MANQQQGSTADQLRSIYAAASKPAAKKAPSAIGFDDSEARDIEARFAARASRPRTAAPVTRPNQNTGDLADLGTNLEIGLRQIPGMLTGLADIPAGLAGFDRPFDRGASAVGRALGVDNAAAIQRLRGELSPATQRSQSAVEAAQGFLPTAGAYLANPRALAADITASIPATIAGGGLGGAIAKTAASVALRQGGGRVASALANRSVAAGIGEGSVAAGAQMDAIDKGVDARKAAVAAIGTGLATAAIAGGGAALANKLGIGDPDLIFVGNRPVLAPGVKKRNIFTRMGMGAVSEGVLQEMPQGAFEQLSQNWAEDKPLLEGVPKAAVSSMLAGMGMGAGAGALNIGGPLESPPPTPESGDGTTAPGGSQGGGPRNREHVTDRKLIGGIVAMAQMLDEATTDEQRTIITQHLRENQTELARRGIDKKIVDKAASEANFDKISERIDKNLAISKGLAAVDVDRANEVKARVDEDIARLVQIEQIHPGTRQRHMDTKFSSKLEHLEKLAVRVQKNASKKSRASKSTRQRNKDELAAARLELEIFIDENPEVVDRYEAAAADSGGQTFDPLAEVGKTIEVPPPATTHSVLEVKPTGKLVAGQPTTTTDQQTGQTETPKSKAPKLSKAEKAEADRVAKEVARRAEQQVEVASEEPAAVVPEDRSAKARLDKLLRATQSTAGMAPEPSKLPPRAEDTRPPAVRSFADRVRDAGARRMYLKKNGQLTKRGEADLKKFESMDAAELLAIQQENAALPKRGPLQLAQHQLIQDILDTTKSGELDTLIENEPVEPLTSDEMANIIIDAQNTGLKANDLTDQQRRYFELYNQFYVLEGKKYPITHIISQLWKEGSGKGRKLLDESTIRKQLDIAADKIVEAIRVRRGYGSRRQAERVLGPMFRGLAAPVDPNTGYRQLSLLEARATRDPDIIAFAEARAEQMGELGLDIDQPMATNDAAGGREDITAREPGDGLSEVAEEDMGQDLDALGSEDVAAADGMGTRGSVNESAPFMGAPKGSLVSKIREMLKFMGNLAATPKQARRLGEFDMLKNDLQDDINDAQANVNSLVSMGDNLAELHASPLFEAAGEAWNRATTKAKALKGMRWPKVRNDPWVLDRWLAIHAGVVNEMQRQEKETDAEFRERVSKLFIKSRDSIAADHKAHGGWLGLMSEAQGKLDALNAKKADLLAEETELLRELGAKVEARDSERSSPPTSAGAAPKIRYNSHRRQVQPSELPPRQKIKRQVPIELAAQPAVREQPLVEVTAVTFANSPFAAGSLRAHNPDVEVATIFANPAAAAAEDTHAILVSTTVEAFLARVAEMQAQDAATDPADALNALWTASYTGAAEALAAGKKLTSPTLDRRLGNVRGVDHALAQAATGENKVQYVELVTGGQIDAVMQELAGLEGVTARPIVAPEAAKPLPRANAVPVGKLAPPRNVRKGEYTMESHERLIASGAFTPYSREALDSLQRVLRGIRPDAKMRRRAVEEKIELVRLRLPAGDPARLRLSVTQRPVERPSTLDAALAAVKRYVPAGRRDAVRVVQSLVELENYLAQHNISISADAGGFTHNGKVFLIADNIESGTVGGVLMHEVGVHLSMSPRQINQLANAIRSMAAKGDKIARRALDAVDGAADTMASYGTEVTEFDENHEVVAYFVEEAVNAGIDPTNLGKGGSPAIVRILRNFMTLVRTSMRALGLSTKSLTAQDIVDAAYGAADTVFRDPANGDPTPRMSLSMRSRVSAGYDKWLAEHPKSRGYLGELKHYTQKFGTRFMFSHDFADWVQSLLPSAPDYFRTIAKRVTAMGKFDADLQHHLNKAKAFSRDQYNAVNDYLILSQQKEAWGFKPHAGALQPNKIDRELANIFNNMAPEQQAFIRETFEMADQLQTQREEVMRNEVEQSINEAAMREPDIDKRNKILQRGVADLAKFDKQFRTRRVAWMPMRRHGEYAAVFISDKLAAAMDEDPTSQEVENLKGDQRHYVVEFHARQKHASDASERMMAAAKVPGKVRHFTRQAQLSAHELIPANFMNAMRANIEADTYTDSAGKQRIIRAWTKMYIEQLAETSIRKSELQRVNVAGFDRDMIRSFTTYGSAIGHTIAGIQMGRETHAVLQRLRSEAKVFDDKSQERSDALNELLERHAFMLEPADTPAQDKVMGWVSMNMLLSSPAYFIVNSTQPFMMTLPVLAGNFGFDIAARRMSANYKVIAKAWKKEHSFAPNQLTQLLSGELADLEVIRAEVGNDAADMMTELQQLGLFDIGIAADLGSLDQSTNKVSMAIAKAHRGATHAVRTVEVFNRGVTALTAFQLATTHPEKIPVGSNGKRPTPREYAIQQVLLTQGDYSGHNAPSFIRRTPLGKVMTQFRKFQLIQIGLLVRTVRQSLNGAGPYEKAMARRQLSYILGMHFVAGGALGLPMANIAGMVFALLNDDDEPDDLEVRLRQELGDRGAADMLLKGMPTAWGVDVSSRVGMGQTFSVLPFTELELTRDSTNAALGAMVFGATGATAGQLADALGQAADGNWGNAIAGAAPRGLRDVVRAFMYKTEGLKRKNPTRDTKITAEEFSTFDTFMQAIGIPSARTTDLQSRDRFYRNYKTLAGDRSSIIKGDYVEAYEANDAVGMQAARNEFNELQEARVRNGLPRQSPSLLHRAVRDKRKREANAVEGVFVDKSDKGFLDLMN